MTEVYEIRSGTEFGYLRVVAQGDSDARGAARFWVVCRSPAHANDVAGLPRLLVKGHKLRHGQRSCGCRVKVPAVVEDAVDVGGQRRAAE